MKRRSLLGDLRWSLVILPLWSCPCPCSTQMSTCEFVGPDWVSLTLIWSQFESLSNVQEGGDDHSWRSPAGDDKGVPLPPGFINIMPPGETFINIMSPGETRWHLLLEKQFLRLSTQDLLVRRMGYFRWRPSLILFSISNTYFPIYNTFFHL